MVRVKSIIQNPRFKKIFFCLLITIYYLLSTIYSSSFAQDKIIAVVNNDIITQKDLNDFINFMRVQLLTEYKGKELENKIQSLKLDLLKKLIEDRLILQEAKKNAIRIDQNRIKARLEQIKKQYSSENEFQNALTRQGFVQADIEARIREQLLMRSIIEMKIKNKIAVNPSEVTNFYRKNIEKFTLPQEREIESITIADENLAKEIYERLKGGENFQAVANRFSLLVNNFNVANNGQLRLDIEEEVFKLKLFEISSPIKIEDSYYIFKLNKIISSRQQNLSEVQDSIYSFLFDKKMQEELVNWLDELRGKSYIKVIDE